MMYPSLFNSFQSGFSNIGFRSIDRTINATCPFEDPSIVTIFSDPNAQDVTANGAHIINVVVITALLALRMRDGWQILGIVWTMAFLNCFAVLHPPMNRIIQLVVFLLLPIAVSRSFTEDQINAMRTRKQVKKVVTKVKNFLPGVKPILKDSQSLNKSFTLPLTSKQIPDRVAAFFNHGNSESEKIKFFYYAAVQTGYVRGFSLMIEIALNQEGFEAPLPVFFINMFSTSLAMIALTGMRNHYKGGLELSVAQMLVFVNCFIYGFLSLLSGTVLVGFCFGSHSAYSASMLLYRSIFGISLLLTSFLYMLIHDDDDIVPTFDSIDEYIERLSEFQETLSVQTAIESPQKSTVRWATPIFTSKNISMDDTNDTNIPVTSVSFDTATTEFRRQKAMKGLIVGRKNRQKSVVFRCPVVRNSSIDDDSFAAFWRIAKAPSSNFDILNLENSQSVNPRCTQESNFQKKEKVYCGKKRMYDEFDEFPVY